MESWRGGWRVWPKNQLPVENWMLIFLLIVLSFNIQDQTGVSNHILTRTHIHTCASLDVGVTFPSNTFIIWSLHHPNPHTHTQYIYSTESTLFIASFINIHNVTTTHSNSISTAITIAHFMEILANQKIWIQIRNMHNEHFKCENWKISILDVGILKRRYHEYIHVQI